MLKRSGEDAGRGALQELQSPQFDLGSPCGGHDRAYGQPWRKKIKVRAPSRHEPPLVLAPSLELLAEAPGRHSESIGAKPRKFRARRRPIAPVIAALLLAAAVSGGFVYLDNASRFETALGESSGDELTGDELRPDGLWLYLASTRHGRMSPPRLLEEQKAQAFQERL